MDTAIKRISDKEAHSLGLTIISDTYFLFEKHEEARMMDSPRAIAKLAAVDTKGVRYLEIAKEKAMLEVILKIDGADHVRDRKARPACGFDDEGSG